eukprot:SAG31_NODE_1866_length_7025_cov_2.554017_5_plen_64_part_00
MHILQTKYTRVYTAVHAERVKNTNLMILMWLSLVIFGEVTVTWQVNSFNKDGRVRPIHREFLL